MLELWTLLATVTAGSFALTWLVLIYAVKRRIVDVPNERSSHTVATPNGGGIAIAATVVAVVVVLTITGDISNRPLIAMILGGSCVAVAGFIDDRHDLSPWKRLIAHFIGAVIIVIGIGPVFDPDLKEAAFALTVFAFILTAAVLVWAVNLYNFMDGIDGIACVQAICMSAIAVFVFEPIESRAPALLFISAGAACAGFLIWNWAPAKIFMGDVGSSFLGLVYASLLLWSVNIGALSIWTACIIPSVFVVDSTLTLATRMIRRDKWFSAHRSHAYQNAARQFRSHAKVSAAVGFLNLTWVVMMASISQHFSQIAPWAFAATYLSLALLALAFHAGRPEINVPPAQIN